MTGPLSIRKLGRGATPCCCCCFFFYLILIKMAFWGGGRWERARFERFLSIIISYFDQNGLGEGKVGESSI